nr:CBS domain-containing protein [Gemmatimonadota bacterium]NIQ57049.1 CBS domain-containing protein [Gemmatimonadota bacterium]NIX46509.1 CBS domain-containing protein [Gemmatimonadota bacterium]
GKKRGGPQPPDETLYGEVEFEGEVELEVGEPGENMVDEESSAIINILYSGMVAADVMTREVITVRPEATVGEVSELFQIHNINGAPVVDDEGLLIGIVTEDDVVVGGMGMSDEELDQFEDGEEAGSVDAGEGEADDPAAADDPEDDDPVAEDGERRVEEIMTPQPIAMEEDTPVEELCRLMWQLKIHRIPIVRSGRVRGIVSTIDLCRLVVEGRARIVPMD